MMRTSIRSLSSTSLLLAGCLLIGGCGDLARSGLKGALRSAGAKMVEKSSDESLRKMFEQANAQCPIRMDVFTTLEEVEMIDEKRVEFRYRVNQAGSKLTSRLDKRAMKKAAVDHMKGNPMAVAVAERDLSIEHIYLDSHGNHLLSYTINKAVLDGDLDPVGQPRSNPFEVSPVNATGKDVVTKTSQDDPPHSEAEVEDSGDEVSAVVKTPEQEERERRISEMKASVQDMQDRFEAERMLPQEYKPVPRTRDNPAGVQGNPYFTD